MEQERKKREYWTEEEDQVLKNGMRKYGAKWAKIANEIGKTHPQILQRHPRRTALRDRAIVLEKQRHEEETVVELTDEQFDRMPDSSRKEWFKEEDEALMQGWNKHGNKWQEIYKEYGPEGNGKLSRHKKENLRHRVMMLQKKLEENQKKVAPVENKEDANKLSKEFMCECGRTKRWSSLMLHGLKCDCERSLPEMVRQVEKQVGWVVYIVLDEDNETGLTGKVQYIGVSEQVGNRKKGHEKDVVQESNFWTFRLSFQLGESQMIELLRPESNVQRSGNKGNSDKCRLLHDNKWVEKDICEEEGMRYDGLIDTRYVKRTFIADNVEHMNMIGTVFTTVGRNMGDDEKFCFRKDQKICICERKCAYRKICNALQGKVIWEGVPAEDVKDTIRPYREVVKVVRGESNPEWDLEYCFRVIDRNEDIKDSTRKDYKRKITTMWEKGILEKGNFMEPWKVIADLRRRGTRNTAKSQIVIIMSLLSHMSNVEMVKLFGSNSTRLRLEYARIQRDIFQEEEKELQNKSEREKRNWAKMEEIKEAIIRMERDAETVYQYQRVVWYKMQVWQGPARNEWSTLKVMNWDSGVDNYVDMGRGVIVLNEYKTRGSMGRREMSIALEVKESLGKLVRRREEKGIEWLFVKMNGERFKGSEFSNFVIRGMEKYIGKRIGSQMQRKIYVSEEREGEKRISEKREMSERMLHSERMSERYRRIS